MMNNYLKLLGLSPSATLEEIKKAYRKCVKQHHPDTVRNEEEKIQKTAVLTGITNAYQYILLNYDQSQTEGFSTKSEQGDYVLYKKGLYFYQLYFDTFFKVFSQRELITPETKQQCLQKARSFFVELIQQFPESIWVYDVTDKIKKIDTTLKTLQKE